MDGQTEGEILIITLQGRERESSATVPDAGVTIAPRY
jgi:hypothetical protein